jgi:hypothetical protein
MLSRGLVFLCIVSLLVLALFVVPAIAQDAGAGPPAGTPVTASNPESPNSPPNLFMIPARDCRVSEGASVTLEEQDGTRARVVDGSGVDITATASQIRIKITGDQFLSDVATFPDPNDQSFDTGNEITVVTTTGISCQGTGTDRQPTDGTAGTPGDNNANAAETQYKADGKEVTVIVETIPDKGKLVDTGGSSLAVIGGVILAIGLVGLGIFLLRRT